MTERAVLAVSFGTSHRDTLEKNIAAIEAELAAAVFPGVHQPYHPPHPAKPGGECSQPA